MATMTIRIVIEYGNNDRTDCDRIWQQCSPRNRGLLNRPLGSSTSPTCVWGWIMWRWNGEWEKKSHLKIMRGISWKRQRCKLFLGKDRGAIEFEKYKIIFILDDSLRQKIYGWKINNMLTRAKYNCDNDMINRSSTYEIEIMIRWSIDHPLKELK